MKRLIIYILTVLTVFACTEKIPDLNSQQSVDLGLSVEWAGWNIGASSPEECGDYFAWGETETKDIYHWDNYIFMNNDTGNYELPGNNICGTKYDAAKEKWGNEWRMPTMAEVQELIDNCTWEYGVFNGQNGYYVTGQNGNSIFIPSAGLHWDGDTEILYKNEYGQYWTGELAGSSSAYSIMFSEWGCEVSDNNPVYMGYPIRAVKNK